MASGRLYKLNSLIQSRPGICLQDIMSELEVSRATAKRDTWDERILIAFCRGRF